MEKITNYKLKDFLILENTDEIEATLAILDLLQPVRDINNPLSKWYNRKPKKIAVSPVKSLTFGQVTTIRESISNPTIDDILETVHLVTGQPIKELLQFTIVPFYSIINTIKADLIEITNMEINELTTDDFDIDSETVNASERMARFGALNPINSLAGDDITKWKEIENMPYMTVFTKLLMDKVKADIQRDITELQKKKQKNV